MPTPLVEVKIEKDEWYPVYCYTEFPTWTISVEPTIAARWNAVFEAFYEVQNEIRLLVDPDD
jgi:hypothetical protein